jgi:uncharacterized protein
VTQWLLDTGPLVAFFDDTDQYHQWALAMWAEAPIPLLTCDPVLAEASYLLRRRGGISPLPVVELCKRGVVQSSFSVDREAITLAELLAKYADRQMDLADACLVRMSELHRDCRVFTLDVKDFTIYRRFERRVIPLIAPGNED